MRQAQTGLQSQMPLSLGKVETDWFSEEASPPERLLGQDLGGVVEVPPGSVFHAGSGPFTQRHRAPARIESPEGPLECPL